MLFSKSPVKDVSQKIKPPQASIKNLKFERKKDFDSFLTYIKRETKTLDDIKLPKTAEVERKPFPLLGALLGFGALGLLGMFGGRDSGSGSESGATDQAFSEKDANLKLTSFSLASMKAYSQRGRSGYGGGNLKKKNDDGGRGSDVNIGKAGKKTVNLGRSDLDQTKRNVKRIIRKKFVTKEETLENRMNKAFNKNKNRRSNVTLSQDMIDELKVEFQQQEAQSTVQGEAARRNVKEEINKQLTIDDARKQAQEKRQKIFARTRVTVESEINKDQKDRDLINKLINPDSKRSVTKRYGESGTDKLFSNLDSESFFEKTKPKQGEIEQQQKMLKDYQKNDQAERQNKAYEKNRKIIKEGKEKSKFKRIKKQYPFTKVKTTEEGKRFKETFRQFYRVTNNTLRVLSFMSNIMGGNVKLTLARMFVESTINDILYNPVADGTLEANIEMMEANRAAQIENLSKLILAGEIDPPDTGFGEYPGDAFATPPSFQPPKGGSTIPFNYSGVLTQEDEYRNLAEELIKLRLGER